MADRPLIFSGPMIRALLDGRKSMTRRVLKPQPKPWKNAGPFYLPSPIVAPHDWVCLLGQYQHCHVKAPYAVGDRLWVKETHWRLGEWRKEPDADGVLRWTFAPAPEFGPVFYAPAGAMGRRVLGVRGWWKRPSIFHERDFSRLTLLVTGVKVERLQEISREDVIAEGITEREGEPLSGVVAGWHEPFAALWDSIHGPGAWEANPWVAAVTFKTVKANIDHLPAEAA